MTSITRKQAALELIRRRRARESFIDFIEYVWWKPWAFLRGRHTIRICAEIDDSIDSFLAGESSYLDIAVPFRHGKSDMVSRALPAYFLGRCFEHDPDLILTGYGASLVYGFSRHIKKVIRSPQYQNLFPQVKLARGEDNVAQWALEGQTGEVNVCGLGGALGGKGGGLIVIDDYCKSRAEARSEKYRRRNWEALTNDVLTRLAPVHMVVLCATPWHMDDMRGRIRKAEAKDPEFPRFKQLKFPAKQKGGKFLFPERYTPEWYKSQYATLGKVWASGLLDCEPAPEGGNRFRIEGIKIHERLKDDPAGLPDWPDARHSRAWDLASTKKERDKDDPDFTVGLLGCVTKDKLGLEELWIKDAIFGQWEKPERKRNILAGAKKDGPKVSVYVEAFGAYKDAFIELKKDLHGQRTVKKSMLPGDKSSKLADLEPIFEAGNVHLLSGPWNDEFIKHFQHFPDGAHDDFCDAAAIIYHEAAKPKSGILPVP